MKNSYAIFYCGVFSLGALLYGYDGTYFTGVEAMSQFTNIFGDVHESNGDRKFSDGILSMLTSLVQVGELIGALAASFIGNWSGRRGGFVGACALVTIGAIVQITSHTVGGLAAGRVILGMGVGVLANCVPLYLSEVAPKEIRGAITAAWQLCLAIGQVVGACVCQGTKGIKNTGSWRIPMALQIVVPVIVFSTIWAIPESPRWLLSKDRQEKAKNALIRIHKEDKEYDPSRDLMEMDSSVRRETEFGQGSWVDLFSNKVELRKLFCCVGILFGQQITGVQFIFSYATIFVENIGISNAFLITIIIDIIEVVGVVVALPLVDRFGRRVLLLPTAAIMALLMFIIGCLDIKHPRSMGANNGIVAMIMLFVFFFNLAAGPLAWTCASELSVGRNRNRIMTLGTASFFIGAWAVAFSLPYLYSAIGPKLCFMYAGLCAVYYLFIQFFIPETKDRSLEEITEMFDLELPTSKWIAYESAEHQRDVAAKKFEDGKAEHVEITDV